MQSLAEHGICKPPEMQGLTDEQIVELKLRDTFSDTCYPSGGARSNPDPIGKRTGNGARACVCVCARLCVCVVCVCVCVLCVCVCVVLYVCGLQDETGTFTTMLTRGQRPASGLARCC